MAEERYVLFKHKGEGQTPVKLTERAPGSLDGRLWELELEGKSIGPKTAESILTYARGVLGMGKYLVAHEV